MRRTSEKWQEFLEKPLEGQVDFFNELVAKNPKKALSEIAKEHLEVTGSAVSKHFGNKGYKFIQGEYTMIDNKEKEKEIKENKQKEKECKSNKNITLEMYGNINNILMEMNDEELDTVTLKLSSEVHNELKDFLKAHKILKKQDVFAVALREFLDKYNPDL